jgi:ribonuclease HI
MSQPTVTHWQAAKGVVRYLSGTINYGITYGIGDTGLKAYTDSDYAGDIDTRRSTTGNVFLLHGGAISWSSRLQQTVAVSTTEAEYMAAAAAVKEALWLRVLLSDFNINMDAILIYGDNQAAIHLVKNANAAARSKHIDIVHHFARERVMRNEVIFEYLPTHLMIADCMTKALPESKFIFCRNGMGVY